MSMRGVLKTLLLLLLAGSAAGLNPAATAGQIVSTPRNVRAVMQARGFYLAPAADAPAAFSAGGVDLAPAQSFEIIRPRGERVRIGRLYTSCTCVQLETAARDYGEGERAIFTLHNVIATPPQGHTYAIYVQITSPIRTTLRYDTFMQSSQFVQQTLPEPVESTGQAGTVGQAGQVVATTPEGIEIIDLTGTMDTEAETAEDPAPAGTAAEAAGAAVGSAAGTAVETAKEVYDAAKEKAGSAAAAVGAAAANAAATTKSRFGAAVEAGRAGLRAAREAYTESREGLSEDIQSALDSELEVEEEAEATAETVAAEASKAAGTVAAEAGKAANAAGAAR